MIVFYSGTPGSGKSFHMAKKMRDALLLHKRNVISTVNIDLDYISNGGKKKLGNFVYVPILDLTPKFLYRWAFKNHAKGVEGQTLLVIDECQIIFNPREYQRQGRSDWILFFTKHRHLGYDIIMTSQFDRLVDRQIRSLFEIELRHRKINNYKWLFLLPITVFAVVEIWYGMRGMKTGKQLIIFRKSIARIYDSYVMYDDFMREFDEEDEPPAASAIEAEQTDERTAAGGSDCAAGAGGPRPKEARAGWLLPRFDDIKQLEKE
jgi:zona occludens toxin (predicted ATPase)